MCSDIFGNLKAFCDETQLVWPDRRRFKNLPFPTSSLKSDKGFEQLFFVVVSPFSLAACSDLAGGFDALAEGGADDYPGAEDGQRQAQLDVAEVADTTAELQNLTLQVLLGRCHHSTPGVTRPDELIHKAHPIQSAAALLLPSDEFLSHTGLIALKIVIN